MGDEHVDYGFTEGAILDRLCKAGPLRTAELVREFGDEAEDCADLLRRRGLAHRMKGGFLIVSAAGRHANSIDPTWQ
jgi:hypothetical protein